MAPNYAISGYSPYNTTTNYNNYGYDPCLLAALQSPNYNMSFKGADSSSVAQAQSATQAVSTNTNASSKSASSEKKGITTGQIIGGVVALGATALITAAAIKGKGSGLEKIWDGLKQIYNGIKGKIVNTKEPFKMFKNETGEWICEVPTAKQSITAAGNEGILTELGISTNVEKLGDAGTKLKETIFVHDGNTFRFKGDKLLSYTNSEGQNLLSKFTNCTEKADIEYKKTILDILKNIKAGNTPDSIKLEKLIYTHTGDGALKVFEQNAAGENILNRVLTRRFKLGSNEVEAFRYDNKSADSIIKSIIESTSGKVPEGAGIAYATSPIGNGNSLVIKNGEYYGLKIGNDLHRTNTSTYKAYLRSLEKGLPDISELAKDNKLLNVKYSI